MYQVWQEDRLAKAMLLQWLLYALYFVIYDCIFPKYILSYLILSNILLVKPCKNQKTKEEKWLTVEAVPSAFQKL